MKGYAAEINGDAIFLTKDAQLDTALKNGCNIVRIEDDDGQTIIATPENGFLEDRPTLEETGTMTNPCEGIAAGINTIADTTTGKTYTIGVDAGRIYLEARD